MLIRVNTASRRPIDGPMAAVAAPRALCSEFKYHRGSEIFGEGEHAEYIYQISYGAVRTYKLLADGRRQINSFHLPGDMFGFENSETHRFTAEAIVETHVRIMKRCNLLDAMPSEAAGSKKLIGFVTENLQHAENHMLLLGRKTSLEKVAAFLLEMDGRLAHPDVMTLPMSRRDIADYLGLTLETVSRALSILRDDKILRFHGTTQREVEMLDREKLAKLDA